MLKTALAIIVSIARADAQLIEARAVADGESGERRVIAYPSLTGSIAVGDRVLLNITATALSLGTGGYDFISANLTRTEPDTFGDPDGTEHIVKLRYTPHQHAVRSVEMIPEYAEIWDQAKALRGIPVAVCELHSQVAAVCAGIKAIRPGARVVYIYSDTAALPMAFSRLIPELKAAKLLDVTITAGQAFGGDYEAVSLASALIAADWIAGADAVVIGQGPGNAGTGTKFGWGGIEQANQLFLARALGGDAIAVLRASDADVRQRHQGISHHTSTVLSHLVTTPVTVAVPDDLNGIHYSEWTALNDFADDHHIAIAHSEPGMALLEERNVRVTSMGRSMAEDRMFFAFAAAAGAVAADRIAER